VASKINIEKPHRTIEFIAFQPRTYLSARATLPIEGGSATRWTKKYRKNLVAMSIWFFFPVPSGRNIPLWRRLFRAHRTFRR
jgi:hypothetical protein